MAEAGPLSGYLCNDTAAETPLRPGLTRRSALALGGGFLLAACAGGPEASAPPAPFVSRGMRADHVVVYKSTRSLHLLSDRKPFASYKVALGFAPEGHKLRDRDGRTPEGVYWIDRRNPRSAFYLSLGISYPNVVDVARSRALGVRPGGDIFIHGEPNDGKYARGTDWTAGCIAVSNSEIEEIWAVVPNGTQISILA
jgi:murein L,D-transpeptidase YafK